jgi:lipopolysaccharide export system protein LptC
MSDLASTSRGRRRVWAAPGGRHDRMVSVAGWLLPVLVGVLAAFLVMAPLTTGGDVSFVLDKNKVDVAKERLKIQAAEYRGQDGRGRAFTLDAGSAVQRSSAEPVVELNKLAAGIQLEDGPASIVAAAGRYDMDREQVTVPGAVRFRAANGYALDTSSATVDLKTRRLRSEGDVTGTVPQGTFRADRLRADLESRTVTLDGNARLRIKPRGAK